MNGKYVVIRCTPDPARGEFFNIGIIIFSETDYLIDIDADACQRAFECCPSSNLALDSFRSLEKSIQTMIGTTRGHKLEQLLKSGYSMFASFSDSMYVSLRKGSLEENLNRLMERLVHTKLSPINEDRRKEALRDLSYATSLAICLLGELNTARAQVVTLEDEHDGRMVICPGNALALNAAVENASRSCREIKK